MTHEVAVVGGGAVGVTAAHDLALAGADVTLFEKSGIAGESTGRAAGVLYDAYAAPEDARVGARAIERFRDLSGEGAFEFVETPYVWFAHEGDERSAEAIRRQVDGMAEQGRDVSLLDPSELEREFPAVRTDDVGVAAVARNAGWTDPAAYAELMAKKSEAAGVAVHIESVGVRTDPPRVTTSTGEQAFDAVLVAAGAHTKRLLADAGVQIPLKPYRVQALVSEFGGERTPMLYDATDGFYLRPHPDGLLAGDGTEPVESDPDDWERDADGWFRESMDRRLSDRVRGYDSNVHKAWAGLCTATPDHDPLLGKLRRGLYVAAGWQGHGFMRAPALGEAIAAEILGETTLSEFDPTRFDGDETFEIVEGMAVE